MFSELIKEEPGKSNSLLVRIGKPDQLEINKKNPQVDTFSQPEKIY